MGITLKFDKGFTKVLTDSDTFLATQLVQI